MWEENVFHVHVSGYTRQVPLKFIRKCRSSDSEAFSLPLSWLVISMKLSSKRNVFYPLSLSFSLFIECWSSYIKTILSTPPFTFTLTFKLLSLQNVDRSMNQYFYASILGVSLQYKSLKGLNG